MSRLVSICRMAAAALACVAASGCATYDRMQAAPAQAQPIAIRLSSDALGMNDLPIGAYRVPDSDVIVSGHQKAGVGIAFGLIGVLVSDAIDTHRGANAMASSEQVMHIHLGAELQADLERQLVDPALAPHYTLAQGKDKTLEIRPAVIMTFIDDQRVRPFVDLSVRLLGSDGRSVWESRYFASTGVERPMEGGDGWAARDGAALKASISASLTQAVKVMLVDVATPYARDEAHMSLVQGRVPFVKQRWQMTGFKLTEDGTYLAFAPKVGDAAVLSGVNIFDKSVIVYRAATPEDHLMILPDTSPEPATAVAAPAPAAVPAVAAVPAPAPAPPMPATASVKERPASARHLDASLLVGKTWRYPHPRDPARFGDVRLAFSGDRVEASNARSSTSGSWSVVDDKLCVKLDNPGWGRICYYLVDDGGAAQLLIVASGLRLPLTVE